MRKILFVTNMELPRTGMEAAAAKIKKDISAFDFFDVVQTDDSEIWGAFWEKRIEETPFVFVTWMGTGLSCDFLRKMADFLARRQRRYLFHIADPGDDKLDGGLVEEEIRTIKAYYTEGGLVNYENLCRWLTDHFGLMKVTWRPPEPLPWQGIYHPDAKGIYTSPAAYAAQFLKPGRPTVGVPFYREDWLWGKLDYIDAIIRGMENAGCNVIAIFTSARADGQSGAKSLAQSMEALFFDEGRRLIDVLVNSFVFSLTTTGALTLGDLLRLDVPVLQVYNLYMDKAWWEKSTVGLTNNEVGYAVAMPEFDGILHSVPTSTNEAKEDGTHYRRPLPERIDMLARKAKKWAALRSKENRDKKVAIVFHNYPPTNSNIGSAASLDAIESIRLLLAEMKKAGYQVDRLPEDSQSFMADMTSHATNDRRFISEVLLRDADGKLHETDYAQFFASLPPQVQEQLTRDWGEAPGEVFHYRDALIVPGMLNGNVFITVQPPRGFGEDPAKIYHSPDCAPTHHYCGFYHWLRDVWQADVMMHVGTHGNLEWLPGKGNAMSNACYPDICTGDMPNVYPYWITCVGEGIQAKRRSAACLISYLSAPMSTAGSYEELTELEQLLEDYCHFQSDDSQARYLENLRAMIRQKAADCHLEEDVPESDAADFDEYVGNLHVFITDIKNMQMTVGLHVLGVPPAGEQLTEYMMALTKLDNGNVSSLLKTLASLHGFDYYDLLENSATMLPDGSMTYGMLLDKIRGEAWDAIALLQTYAFDASHVKEALAFPWAARITAEERENLRIVLQYMCEHIAPSLLCTTWEQENSLRSFAGHYVEPSASGAPTSGGADLLPTGRNFYSVDPRTLPTKAAWEIGKCMGEDVILRFVQEEGRYPESVGIILWATSNLRNRGQCVAEFLWLMGVRPVWQAGSLRVVDLEILPLSELKRPRVDVTGRISGLFRDSMPGSVTWLDDAVRRVAALDEPLDMNFVRKHVLAEAGDLEAAGMDKETAWRHASFRIFGDPPGAHGAGIGSALEAKNWETIDDLAAIYTRWGAHAYGDGSEGAYLPERFQARMKEIDVTVQNVDHRESSMLAGDDYNNYRGGLVAAVRAYKGSMPKNYVSDSSDRSKVQLRTLKEELKRWYRGEAINPKYIEGMMKHGYAGAGELATYAAVSFQWDATSDVMEDWMYETYAEKYALDPKVQKWMREVNPWALHRIADVLLEAEKRGLWNAKEKTKKALEGLFLEIEGDLEAAADH